MVCQVTEQRTGEFPMHPLLLIMFLFNKLVGEFISQFSMTQGQTLHRSRNNIFINNLLCILVLKVSDYMISCCFWGNILSTGTSSEGKARSQQSCSTMPCHSPVSEFLAEVPSCHGNVPITASLWKLQDFQNKLDILPAIAAVHYKNQHFRVGSVYVISGLADRARLPQKHAAAFPSHSHLKAA